MGKYIMALDQGTTSSRCILFDKEGKICALAQKEFTQYYPKPGWVEHDPTEIWASMAGVIAEALGKSKAGQDEIEAIGITNQRETTLVWEKETGKPIYPAIVWQCRRTAKMIEKLNEDGMGELVKERTGLIPDAYFSAGKLAWILENVPKAREKAEKGELLFGTVDTWLIWNLTEGKQHVTDYTNASRTMLFDIHKGKWDEDILRYFRIPKQMLPKVQPSGSFFGTTIHPLFRKEIPIAGVAGDQQAALFGQCCFEKGDAKNTYGTGCFLLMNTGNSAIASRHGLLTTIAADLGEEIHYALEGSVFVAGAAIQWLRDEMKMIESAPLSMEAAEKVKDTEGVYVVPAFTGLGAPHWNPYARGMILGLTRGTGKNHVIRATLESLAYQTKEVILAMEKDAGVKLTTLNVDGGASNNDFLMQFQSDILDAKVLRPECVETTALGAAYLAGLTTGFWKDKEELRKNRICNREFLPLMSEEDRTVKQKGWEKAVKCALFYAETEDGESDR